ncbi:hypothetical protein AB0G37_17365, partial [Streptomyces fradiae]
HGDFTAYGYRSAADGVEHVALVHGDLGDGEGVRTPVPHEVAGGRSCARRPSQATARPRPAQTAAGRLRRDGAAPQGTR